MQLITHVKQNKTLVAAISLFVCGCGILVWTLVGWAVQPAAETIDSESAGVVVDQLAEPEAVAPTVQPPILVYVSGGVQVPDVYRLPAEARVKDLILAAGGIRPDADLETVNLAAPLEDAQHVHVPLLGDAPAESQSVSAPEAGADSGLLNINTASAEQFDQLPGVGMTIAERIVAYRESNGPFVSIADLRNVQGIGPALLEKITVLVTVGS